MGGIYNGNPQERQVSRSASHTAPHCLQHGSGQLQNLDLGTFAVLHAHRDSSGFREWIGKHFEFLPVQPNMLAGTITQGFDAVAHLSNGIVSRKAGHDRSILPLGGELGEGDFDTR